MNICGYSVCDMFKRINNKIIEGKLIYLISKICFIHKYKIVNFC